MAEKKSFALRMNAEMMKAVEKWAADEFRSTNGQLEWIVQEALKKAGRLPPSTPTKDLPEGAAE
jgi:hypothetical protein